VFLCLQLVVSIVTTTTSALKMTALLASMVFVLLVKTVEERALSIAIATALPTASTAFPEFAQTI